MKRYTCSLASYIRHPSLKYNSELVYNIAYQVAFGMKEIHNIEVVHYDLKPRKIIVTLL